MIDAEIPTIVISTGHVYCIMTKSLDYSVEVSDSAFHYRREWGECLEP